MKCRLVIVRCFDGAHVLHLSYSYFDRMVRGRIIVFGACILHIRGFLSGLLKGYTNFLQKTFFFTSKESHQRVDANSEVRSR